ncbi:hypothetical protein PUN28_016167 [Cardiocondyla obscurior]|uniref:SWIM-type domain-containing protein n=1 Tax=Cardiocondyla obscurior TaxID=286306 RepID=A0AAW2ESE0_9HYME
MRPRGRARARGIIEIYNIKVLKIKDVTLMAFKVRRADISFARVYADNYFSIDNNPVEWGIFIIARTENDYYIIVGLRNCVGCNNTLTRRYPCVHVLIRARGILRGGRNKVKHVKTHFRTPTRGDKKSEWRHASPRASWDRTLLLVCFNLRFDVHTSHVCARVRTLQ